MVKLREGFFFRKISVEVGFDDRASSWVICFSLFGDLMFIWDLPYIRPPLRCRTFAIEKLFVAHSWAEGKLDRLSFSWGVRIPALMFGYPILPTKSSGADFPEKWRRGFGWWSLNAWNILQGLPHRPFPLHRMHRFSMEDEFKIGIY